MEFLIVQPSDSQAKLGGFELSGMTDYNPVFLYDDTLSRWKAGARVVRNGVPGIAASSVAQEETANVFSRLNTFRAGVAIGSGAKLITLSASPNGSYPIILPAAQGVANSLLVNDGNGNLTWSTISAGGLGIVCINGQLATSQSMTTGVAGTDFNIASGLSVHTFNIPSASAGARGLLTSTDWSTFNAKQPALGFTAVPNTRQVNGHALSADVTVSKGDVGLGSVENTALSTWIGTSSVTTLGTIITGVWHGTAIDHTYLTGIVQADITGLKTTDSPTHAGLTLTGALSMATKTIACGAITSSGALALGTNTIACGAITTTGTLAVNVSTGITTNQTTFPLVNATATTINFGAAASVAINMGNASGTTTILGTIIPSALTASQFVKTDASKHLTSFDLFGTANTFTAIQNAGTWNATTAFTVGGTTVIDSSKNLSNIGSVACGAITSSGALALGVNTITSGLINGQTISSTANFTGTAIFAGATIQLGSKAPYGFEHEFTIGGVNNSALSLQAGTTRGYALVTDANTSTSAFSIANRIASTTILSFDTSDKATFASTVTATSFHAGNTCGFLNAAETSGVVVRTSGDLQLFNNGSAFLTLSTAGVSTFAGNVIPSANTTYGMGDGSHYWLSGWFWNLNGYNTINSHLNTLDDGSGNVTLAGNLSNTAFASGSFGCGWRFTTATNTLELDNLVVRNAFRTAVFQKDVVRATNGYLLISDSTISQWDSAIDTSTNWFAIFVKEAVFQAGDLIWYKDVADDGSSIAGIKLKVQVDARNGVLATIPGGSAKQAYQYIVCAHATYGGGGGSGTIKSGGVLVRVGGGTGRQGSLYFDASSSSAPIFDTYDGVATWSDFQSISKVKSRIGNLASIVSPKLGTLQGYGLYSQNVYLEGNANIIGNLSVGDARFYAGKVSTNLKAWSDNSNMSLNIWTNGGYLQNNEYQATTKPTGFNGAWHIRTSGYAYYMWLGDCAVNATTHGCYFAANTTYTVSYWIMSDNADFTLSPNAWDVTTSAALGGNNVTLKQNVWQRVSCTFTTPASHAFRFSFGLYSTPLGTSNVYLTGIQVEQGTLPTAYQPTDGGLSSDGGYGMWSVAGGFGGTIQNPVIALNAWGMSISPSASASTTIGTGTLQIGNITGVGTSAIKITNTGTGASSGLFGYSAGSAESFALRLDGSASIAGWSFNGTTISSAGGGLVLSSGASAAVSAGYDANNNATLFFTDSTHYGVAGKLAGSYTFQLGSTNQIAGWNFTGSTFSDASGYVTIDSANKSIIVNTDLSMKRVYVGHLPDVNGNWTTNYGISFVDFTAGKEAFRLSNIGNQIAGWSFDSQKINFGDSSAPGSNAISIASASSGDGGWAHNGSHILKGVHLRWNNTNNSSAGSLVIGQMLTNATNEKAGFLGLQMMDYGNNEYFALGADTASSGGIYARIGGWRFDNSSISSGSNVATAGAGMANLSNAGAIQLGWGDGTYTAGSGMNYVSLGGSSYIVAANGQFDTSGWDYNGGGVSINVLGQNVFFAGRRSTTGGIKSGAAIAGWNFDGGYLWTGTKQTTDTYSASGITLAGAGGIRAKQFYLGVGGDAHFSGSIEGATITGGILQTAASGSRIVINSSGINYTNAAGSSKSWIDGSSHGTDGSLLVQATDTLELYAGTVLIRGGIQLSTNGAINIGMYTPYDGVASQINLGADTYVGNVYAGMIRVGNGTTDTGFVIGELASNNRIRWWDSATEFQFYTHNNGYANARGGTWTNASDARLKTGVENITSSLDMLRRMRGVSFGWLEGDTRKHFGFIAQEFQEICPNLVSGDGSKENFLGISYTEVIPILVESAKEIDAEVTALKARVTDLEAQVVALKPAA